MNCVDALADLLPEYVAGTLEERERALVERHLAGCPQCRSDLALWQAVAGTVTEEAAHGPLPSRPLVEGALTLLRRRRVGVVLRAWQLVAAQVPLFQRELWYASALVMALGYVVAIASGPGKQGSVIEVLAPLVAAAGVALVYGQYSDPALELALATPTSPRQVLLARLLLVFGYDLLISLVASLGLIAVVPLPMLGDVIWGWLGPMTFLSALALVLSLVVGTGGAVATALIVWWARWLARGTVSDGVFLPDVMPTLEALATAFDRAWANPSLLLVLSAGLLALSLWLVGRQEWYVGKRAGLE